MMSFAIASPNKLTNAKINHSQLFKKIIKREVGEGQREAEKQNNFEQDQDFHSFNAQEASPDKH